MAVRSKNWICGLFIAGIGVRMPRVHGSWSLKFVVSCVSSDFCYGTITRLEELYRVCVRARAFVIHARTHARARTHTHTYVYMPDLCCSARKKILGKTEST
jgi:hypothetical protein